MLMMRASAAASRGGPGPHARQLRHISARVEGPEFSVADNHAAHVKEGGGGWIRPVVVRDGVVFGGWR